MSTTLDRFKDPKYTGENRCPPCTVVNVVLALALAAGIGLVQPMVGGVALLACLAAIYFRGYLVPGTPTLTKRYFPEWLLAWFDKGDVGRVGQNNVVESARAASDDDQNVDPETLLVSIGVVEECETEDDLCLTNEFAADWRTSAHRLRDDVDARRAAVADLLDRDDLELFEDSLDRWVVSDGSNRLYKWVSEGAAVADLAAARAIAERIEWTAIAPEQRVAILKGLRPFLDECPLCGGEIAVTEDTVESCCRSWDVLAIRCVSCEEHFLEIDPETMTEADRGRAGR